MSTYNFGEEVTIPRDLSLSNGSEALKSSSIRAPSVCNCDNRNIRIYAKLHVLMTCSHFVM